MADALAFRVGPWTVRLHTPLPEVRRTAAFLYRDYPRPGPEAFVDYEIALLPGRGGRRWWRPQVRFLFEGQEPFAPLTRAQAYPFFEWGLNWCLAHHTADYLVLHAAVLERDGRALVLPGPPGAGKSTLCAALALSGWRLLTDELGLLSPADGCFHPLPRPVSLKNAAIDVIRRFSSAAALGPSCHDTHKGTVAHLRVPAGAVAALERPARPGRIVFPRFVPGLAGLRAGRLERARALVQLAEQAFNLALLGEAGFEALCALVDGTEALTLEYGDLAPALAWLERAHP
ncbi:MAG: HprK-related kinase A [Gammaproteobacteria bacterium]|nr:MAG: HprK-related kinase A [Gammaproteobacteria bacterium]